MCGFIACKKAGIGSNDLIRRRGEDCTTTLELPNGYIFVHNLLSLTGTFVPQPFVDEKIFCVYNGEIYNQPFVRTDGEVLIPLYRKYGEKFTQYLEGEFSIALYDFENQTAVFSTDAFRSKPIVLNNDGAASYISGLKNQSKFIPPNTTVIRNLKTNSEKRLYVHDFDFNHQEKKTYDGWITAFDKAVLKRSKSKRVFLGLSSGYDSGAIHCSLKKQGLDHTAFSILGTENLKILNARGVNPVSFTKSDFDDAKKFVSENVEDFEYNIYGDHGRIKWDGASAGLVHIFKKAREQERRIYISGQGSDEIISDYSKWSGHNDFKGKFPKNLAPWGNFYNNCQEAYLAKEEHVAGSLSIETRYPFLDMQVVQEFLWLDVELKNKYYKAPVREYLIRNKYPFEENQKHGFNPKSNLM